MSSFVSVDANGNLVASGVTEEMIQARIDAAVNKLRSEMSTALGLKLNVTASQDLPYLKVGGTYGIKAKNNWGGGAGEGGGVTRPRYISDGFVIRASGNYNNYGEAFIIG